ncbi:hypothetical protein ACHAPJ_006087 [Fusarium lateritium]
MATMDTLVDTVNATGKAPLHPYFPLNAALPGYTVNTMTGRDVVVTFSIGTAAIFAVTLLLIQITRPALSRGAVLATMWFTLCGCIHLFFEGYYVVNFISISSKLDLFAQLWKEYSLSDSRYLTQDAFMVCMEAVTAFVWGPMSFACAWCIVKEHPMRHPLQIIISLGQIYGDVLYLGICTFEEIIHEIVYCRPERFYYYMYYLLCNGFWIVIPGVLLVQSVKATAGAFAKVQAAEKNKKAM